MKSLLIDRVEALKMQLRALPPTHSTAFAALGTERLYPYFEQYARCTGGDDLCLFQQLLDAVWKLLLGSSAATTDFSKLKDQCLGIDLGEEGTNYKHPLCDPGQGAIDAVGALYQTLELCEGANSDKAAKVAEIAMDRIRLEVERAMAIPTVTTNEEEEQIEATAFRSPEMRREISIQDKQLAGLKGVQTISKDLIEELRALSARTDTH